MGCDINLYAEGLLPVRVRSQEKSWINIDHWYRQNGWAQISLTNQHGFHYTDLIDGSRDYGLFYLLAGVRGRDEDHSYPPISPPKGLPSQMDDLVCIYGLQDCEIGTADCHDASFLSLGELRHSGYGGIMRIRGWVRPQEYREAVAALQAGQEHQLHFVDVKDTARIESGMVLREWDGYLNLNLTRMIRRLEALGTERRIENDEEIRIVFWFDS